MARLAAARGMLPLGPEESLQALAFLSSDADVEVRDAVEATLKAYDKSKLRPLIEHSETSPEVLGFVARWKSLPRDVLEPLILHPKIPDESLLLLAGTSELGEVLELIAIKQQALIRSPEIIDAILANPRRTPEAERRAKEVRHEFFEKDYGAQVVAGEQRAQDGAVAGEAPPEPTVFIDDLSQFIEADLIDTGDALFEQFEQDYGPIDDSPGLVMDVEEFAKFFDEEDLKAIKDFEQPKQADGAPERVSIIARIAQMTVKDKIKFGLKGTREVRMILIRDPNRPVCAAVIANPKITDQEIETISALKGVNEEVLRLIGTSRGWTRSYNVIHNLVRNPKTPVALSLNFLNRLQNKDLRTLGTNKNVPEVVRTMAARTFAKRQAG